MSDHALLSTARVPIYTGMPPLISYVDQRSHGIGESNRQLLKHVMYRNSRASTMSRAMHLPILLKVFDFIQRTTAFLTPMYQRMLDLPWFRWRRKRGKSSIQTKGAIADRQRHIGQQPDELYSNMLLQTLRDTEEHQVGDEVDETYPQATEEAYPMTNIDPLSPLPMMRKPATSAHDFPHAIGPRDLPQYTKKIVAQHEQNMQTQPSHLAATEQSVRKPIETPMVVKNVLPSPAAGRKLPDTDSEASHYVRPTYNLEPESGSEFASPHARQSDTTVPAIHKPYDIREPDHTQAKSVEGRPAAVYRQLHHKYRTLTLSPALMPITQQIYLHRKSIKAGLRTIGEDTKETQSSNICIGTQDEPIGQAVHTSHPLPFSQQSAPIELTSFLQAPSSLSGPAISRSALGRLSLFEPPMIARYPGGMASSTLQPEASLPKEGTEIFTGAIPRQSAHQVRQARRETPLFTSPVELPEDKADAIYQTEGMLGDYKSKYTVEPSSPEQGRAGLGFTSGRINKLLFYSQPLSVAGSFIQVSPDHKRIGGAGTSPTGTYDVVFDGENASSYPDVTNMYQKSPELVLPSLFQGKAEPNQSYPKEVFKGTPDIFPELMYSRIQNVPELKRAPISRIPDIQTQPAEPEPEGAGSNEMAVKDELENIARDVYHILKRRLARERERALGVV